MKNAAPDKKGIAFLTTIILLGLTVVASAALSMMLLRDAYDVKRLKYSSQAYYLAEAGIEEAIAALWANNFSSANFPIIRNLGEGSINVTLNNSKWASDKILLISSAAVVNGVSRTVKTEVKSNVVPGFDYAVLSNGKVLVSQLAEVHCNTSKGAHSNSSAQGGFLSNSAVDVWGYLFPCYIYGDASAVGNVRARYNGVISGSQDDGAAGVSLPPLDTDFFNYYFNQANASGDVYTPSGGTQYFDGVTLSPGNGVVYVNGNVNIKHDVTINGCLVATGDIWINFWTEGTVTQNQVGGMPAMMSRGGDITVWDPATLNGLLYAAGDIKFRSLAGAFGDIFINGSIVCGGDAVLKDMAYLNYVKQNPPGLGSDPIGWILNWNE